MKILELFGYKITIESIWLTVDVEILRRKKITAMIEFRYLRSSKDGIQLGIEEISEAVYTREKHLCEKGFLEKTVYNDQGCKYFDYKITPKGEEFLRKHKKLFRDD